MVFYNDVLYASMKRVYGHEELIGAPKCLVKEEVKVKRKLEKIKKKVIHIPLFNPIIYSLIVQLQTQ